MVQQINFVKADRKRLIKLAEESKGAVAQHAPKAFLGTGMKVKTHTHTHFYNVFISPLS